MDPLPDTHKKVLQHLMHMKNIPENVLLNTLKEITGNNDSLQDLNNIILGINAKIVPFKQQIKNVIEENTGQNYYVLLNTIEDSISQSLCSFNDHEKEYISLLFTSIILSENHEISYESAYNLILPTNIKLKKQQIQMLLINLLSDKYLFEENRKLTLGVQYIYECEPIIRKQFMQWVQSCNLCKELVFKYAECPACHERFHRHCIKKYISSLKGCPKCKAKWANENI